MRKVFDKALSDGYFRLSLNGNGLSELFKELEIDTLTSDEIKRVLEHLFEKDRKRDIRSIVNANKFDIYFDNTLNTEGILFREFTPVLTQSWNDIKVKFDSWKSEGKVSYLIEILNSIDQFESREKFEKIAKLWISLVNSGVRQDKILVDWINSVSRNEAAIGRFYGMDKTFFESIFSTSSDCFFYDTYAIRIILRNYIDDIPDFTFPLSKMLLQEISVKRLKEFVDTRKQFDVRVFNLFYYNCWSGKTPDNNIILLGKAHDVVRGHVEQFPYDFLRFVVRSRSAPHLDEEYVFEPFIPQYFGSWDKFEKFLHVKAEENDEFKLLVNFFNDFKKSERNVFHSEEMPPWIDIQGGNSVLKYFKHQTYEAFVDEMNAMTSKSTKET
ncbi:MAG: hypothetical protein RH948_01665 [Cyclobacteriaceae bacterium]